MFIHSLNDLIGLMLLLNIYATEGTHLLEFKIAESMIYHQINKEIVNKMLISFIVLSQDSQLQ